MCGVFSADVSIRTGAGHKCVRVKTKSYALTSDSC
jgi:hypothetical protein